MHEGTHTRYSFMILKILFNLFMYGNQVPFFTIQNTEFWNNIKNDQLFMKGRGCDTIIYYAYHGVTTFTDTEYRQRVFLNTEAG